MQLLVNQIITCNTEMSLKDSSSFIITPARIQNTAYI